MSWLSAEYHCTFNEIGYVAKYKLIGCTDQTVDRLKKKILIMHFCHVVMIVFNHGFICFMRMIGVYLIIYSGPWYEEGFIFHPWHSKSEIE